MHLSDKERKYIIRRTADAIGRIQTGEDAIAVLSEIYCQNMEDKSPRQGQLMAEEVLRWIGKFQNTFEDAMEDPVRCFRHNWMQTMEAVPLDAQCDLLRRELGLSADAGEPVSPQLRDSLLEELSGRLTDADPKGMEARFTLGDPTPDNSNRTAAKAVIGEDMLLAVTAMVLYTMVQNGQLETVEPDLTLAQAVIGVCAEDELAMIRVLAQSEMHQQRVQKRMKALRVTCFVTLAAALGGMVLAGSLAAVSGLAIESILAVCGYLLLWLGIVLELYYRSMAEMIRDEEDEFPYIPVHVNPAAAAAAEEDVLPNHLPWPEPASENEEEKENTRQQASIQS